MAKKNKNEIKVFGLGGLGEVGKNSYCVEYLDQIFIIDAGVLFADSHLPGVDYVLPDFSYLKENEDRIVGLFITHGHEDHIGGIPYLVRQVNIKKIYASGIAIDLITGKFEDFPDLVMPTIIPFKSDSVFNFKGLEMSFIRLNHSIPDEHAIVFKTEEGTIIHTGDFKVDFTPVGPKAEYDKLTRLGNEGVLLLLSDSTNAMNEGFSSSERKVGESIHDLFSHIEGRAIIATFASNLYRIEQIIDASIQNGRKVAVFGRSMERMIESGIKAGYIKAKAETFVEAEMIDQIEAKKLTLLCTGSQGEPMAALSRVAAGSHKYIHLIPGDTVIFSSSPIPGNAEGVNRTINALYKAGANVIVNSPLSDTHTSGHANQGELKLIHSLLRPKFFAPIHGEYRMQRMHTIIANECGCPLENCLILENGQVLHVTKDEAYIDGKVKSGVTYIEGNRVGLGTANVINERRILSNEGLFSLIITLKGKVLIGEPQVVSRGFIYLKGNEDLTKSLVQKCKVFLQEELNKQAELDIASLKDTLETKMSDLIVKTTDRNPIIIVDFMIIE